jgi:hypothetical protein
MSPRLLRGLGTSSNDGSFCENSFENLLIDVAFVKKDFYVTFEWCSGDVVSTMMLLTKMTCLLNSLSEWKWIDQVDVCFCDEYCGNILVLCNLFDYVELLLRVSSANYYVIARVVLIGWCSPKQRKLYGTRCRNLQRISRYKFFTFNSIKMTKFDVNIWCEKCVFYGVKNVVM